jgi:hypothetical protein
VDKARITASLKAPLDTLLKPHRLFGGRDEELACLYAICDVGRWWP